MSGSRAGKSSRPPLQLSGEGVWTTKAGFYLLWWEFLAVSPSYELARRYRAGTLTNEDRKLLPADFEDVLSVYDDIGDVQRVVFREWWSERGLSVFGYKGSKPRVRRVDSLTPTRHRNAAKRVEDFIKDEWAEQGQPNALLVSIPLGLSKTDVTRQLKKLMDRYAEEHRILPDPVTKYPLLGTKQRKDTLFRYLFVVWIRCAMPHQPLWRVGVRSKVSDTYSPELDAKAQIQRGEQVYDRSMLAVLTSRAWSRGMALAENAARGQFPLYKKPEHAVTPDPRWLWNIINSRRLWKKKIKQNQDQN